MAEGRICLEAERSMVFANCRGEVEGMSLWYYGRLGISDPDCSKDGLVETSQEHWGERSSSGYGVRKVASEL